jgi:hypothetical protein
MSVHHPDDPAQGLENRPWDQDADDYNARYVETYDIVHAALSNVQRHYGEILAAVSTLEEVGVCHPYGDWSTEDLLSVVAMNAHAIAMDAGMDAAERGMDHGGRVDIAVAASARDLARIMGAGK